MRFAPATKPSKGNVTTSKTWIIMYFVQFMVIYLYFRFLQNLESSVSWILENDVGLLCSAFAKNLAIVM